MRGGKGKIRSSSYNFFLRLVSHLQSPPVPASNTIFDDEWTKIVPRHQAKPDRPPGSQVERVAATQPVNRLPSPTGIHSSMIPTIPHTSSEPPTSRPRTADCSRCSCDTPARSPGFPFSPPPLTKHPSHCCRSIPISDITVVVPEPSNTASSAPGADSMVSWSPSPARCQPTRSKPVRRSNWPGPSQASNQP